MSDTEEGDTDTLGGNMEISISVPNLSDIIIGDNHGLQLDPLDSTCRRDSRGCAPTNLPALNLRHAGHNDSNFTLNSRLNFGREGLFIVYPKPFNNISGSFFDLVVKNVKLAKCAFCLIRILSKSL